MVETRNWGSWVVGMKTASAVFIRGVCDPTVSCAFHSVCSCLDENHVIFFADSRANRPFPSSSLLTMIVRGQGRKRHIQTLNCSLPWTSYIKGTRHAHAEQKSQEPYKRRYGENAIQGGGGSFHMVRNAERTPHFTRRGITSPSNPVKRRPKHTHLIHFSVPFK